jgi:hypothetical protein
MAQYQCIYCKARYEHDGSYAHNAYQCPKQRSKGMKSLAAIMVVCMLGLTGCEALDKYLNPGPDMAGATKASITIHKADKDYTFNCDVDTASSKLANCVEVK